MRYLSTYISRIIFPGRIISWVIVFMVTYDMRLKQNTTLYMVYFIGGTLSKVVISSYRGGGRLSIGTILKLLSKDVVRILL